MSNKTRILYVEDEASLRLTVCKMLELLGYEVQSASNGKLGVDKAKEWKPDVILMDVRMPVMTGTEATKVLRETPGMTNIPIYILSAYTDNRTRQSCETAGATRFLTKPVDIRKIDEIIKDNLSQQRQA